MGNTAKFVTAALDLEEWEEEMGMVGENVTFNEIVAITEKVTKRRFLIKYKNFEKMDEQGASSAIARGGALVPPTPNCGYPKIAPWRLEAWWEKWWGGLDLGESTWGDNEEWST
ncbi:hypothetical protein MMC27_005305 [Xylographa pallens]|nr:hypothetical protein [Xylographa pallens]